MGNDWSADEGVAAAKISWRSGCCSLLSLRLQSRSGMYLRNAHCS